jgi:hypothetical protein
VRRRWLVVAGENFRQRLIAAVAGLSPRDRTALLRNLIGESGLNTLYDVRDRLEMDFGVNVADTDRDGS